ncbi:MAG: shikimate kinase [Actinobacteria bacterium]|uniref:shikimate kinase n=1 Tax=freshwater metagenome TaxID=449393 RepID=A0A6J7GUY7_9ZZZZ|nr:shikimate kinase [Actinomycetota bacterium]
MSPVAVLVGAPGAGKSTVGKRLATALGVPFADSDLEIEHEAGMSVSDIFVTQGEPAFRELEEAVIAKALAEHEGVLALGGGAIMNAQTRDRLKGLPVIWLDVDLGQAAKRVGMNQARPLLLGDIRANMNRLMKERTPIYQEVSTIVVNTSGLKVREVVDEIIKQINAEENHA